MHAVRCICTVHLCGAAMWCMHIHSRYTVHEHSRYTADTQCMHIHSRYKVHIHSRYTADTLCIHSRYTVHEPCVNTHGSRTHTVHTHTWRIHRAYTQCMHKDHTAALTEYHTVIANTGIDP